MICMIKYWPMIILVCSMVLPSLQFMPWSIDIFKLLSKDIPVSPKKGKISLNLCPSALSLLEIYARIVLLVGFAINLPKI